VNLLHAACWGWWECRSDPYFSPLHTALSKAAEVYFKAVEKIGERALQSSTSHVLGKALAHTTPVQEGALPISWTLSSY